MVKAELIPYAIEGFYRSGLWKNFVLKGGTALMLFYIPNFRKSVDLDFVVYEDNDDYKELEYYCEKLKILGRYLRKELFGEPKFYVRYGGIEGKIPINVVRGTTPQIKVDITYGKYNRVILPPNTMELNLIKGVYARVMDLKEIYAEKIRSLMQRTQVRDLYDVYFLSHYIEAEEIATLVQEKIEILSHKRNISVDYDKFFEKKDKYEKEYPKLRGYVVGPPEFGEMWNKVAEVFRRLREIQRCRNYEIDKSKEDDFEISL